MRDERYRFTTYDKHNEQVELYDHEVDPFEWNNLADDPNYADVIANLSQWVPENPHESVPAN